MEYRTSKQVIVFTCAEIVHDTLAFIRVSIKKKRKGIAVTKEKRMYLMEIAIKVMIKFRNN